MIKVPQEISLTSVDELIDKVNQNEDEELQFPRRIDQRSILASAAYIQFLLTWAQRSSTRKIQFTVGSKEECMFLPKAAETLIPILLGKVVSILSTQTAQPIQIDLPKAREEGLNTFAPVQGVAIQQNLFGPDEPEFSDLPRKGPKVHLLMSDADFRHGFSHWFYTGSQDSRQLRDAGDLASLVRTALELLRNHSTKKFGSWTEGLPEIMGDMLFELIDNTHKWGCSNLKREPIKSLRGVLFDVKFDYPGNRTRVADIAVDIPLISEFIGYHQQSKPDLGLLEMSVFDGGIGLSARELERQGNQNPTIEKEYEAALACLRKRGTTSGQPGRGLGLDRVLDLAAKRKGFVYLRTGRLILYRDFANHPASFDETASNATAFEKHILNDRTTQSSVPTTHSSVVGTLFTVILPFNAAP
ncbi:MAG: hypothetical protein V4672_06385 [Verrucomicrobiota bacterium]